MSRDVLITDWLQRQYPNQHIDCVPASADASFRRYFRLTLPDGSTRILMDAPPDQEDCRPFVKVAGLLAEAGVFAPKIEIADLEHGLLVLSDLGRISYLTAFQTEPQYADTLMRPVLDVLVKWQLASRPDVLSLYDEVLLRRELDLFPIWFVGRHLGRELDDEDRTVLDSTFRLLIDSALAQPRVFVHRDFMPRNLMLVESEPGVTPGILDFQDAVYGPIAYDVVSLFRDAFISWEEEQEIDWVVRYWEKARAAGLPVPTDFAQFWQDYEWMGLQRHLKVLGIFCRLNYRDGKSHYLADLPRFLGYARTVADRYLALKPFLTFLDKIEDRQPDIGRAIL
jgi:N-acetylmuramate 1-kinase